MSLKFAKRRYSVSLPIFGKLIKCFVKHESRAIMLFQLNLNYSQERIPDIYVQQWKYSFWFQNGCLTDIAEPFLVFVETFLVLYKALPDFKKNSEHILDFSSFLECILTHI